jgi:hypothetical protein
MAKKVAGSHRASRYTPPATGKGFSGFWSRLSSRQRGQFVTSAGASALLVLFLIVRALLS